MLKTPSKSRICCQVCFDYFSLKEILFRCSNKTCPAENDPVRAKFLGTAQSIDPKVITPSATSDIKQGTAICTQCQQPAVIQICPRCHCEIPQEVWGAPNMTIAIVGSVGAGKTVYLTSTMKHLRENLGDYLGSEAGVQTATLRTNYDIEKQEQNLFVQNKVPETTNQKVINPEVRLPFSYKLNSWVYRKGFRPLKKKLETYLSIFDAAGEDFSDPTDTITLTQIPNSQGIIMFIDPMSFPGIAAALGQTSFSLKSPTEILDSFYNAYILKTPDLSLGDKISVPTAFVLGKSDMIEATTAAYPQVNNPPAHDKGVDLKAIEDSSEATRTLLLDELGGGPLCGTIKNRFSNHCFFTVSCGRSWEEPDPKYPDDPKKNIGRFDPNPSRIMDPILWILWSAGRIPATD